MLLELKDLDLATRYNTIFALRVMTQMGIQPE